MIELDRPIRHSETRIVIHTRRNMRWYDYVGTAFIAAICTIVLMLCI